VGQTVLPQGETIDGQRRYVKDLRKITPMPEMPMRATSRVNQAWKHVQGEDGTLQNYRCPDCAQNGRIGRIRYLRDHVARDHGSRPWTRSQTVVGCDNPECSWTIDKMTPEQRAALERIDPEALRVAEHDQKMTGKERRTRKFLSKCAYGGRS
jgi:hypothetical protein